MKTIDRIITSCAILHNLMKDELGSNEPDDDFPLPEIFVPMVPNLGRPLSRGTEVRNKFMNYFVHERQQQANIE